MGLPLYIVLSQYYISARNVFTVTELNFDWIFIGEIDENIFFSAVKHKTLQIDQMDQFKKISHLVSAKLRFSNNEIKVIIFASPVQESTSIVSFWHGLHHTRLVFGWPQSMHVMHELKHSCTWCLVLVIVNHKGNVYLGLGIWRVIS